MDNKDIDKAFSINQDEISRNIEAFDRNNAARVERLSHTAAGAYRRAFYSIPVLLHLNYPGVPGFVDHRETPFGVRHFPESEYAEIGRKHLPNGLPDYHRIIKVDRPIARSLFLIGSPGTVGYTGASDLDYWICLDRPGISAEAWKAYLKKLKIITAWVRIKLGVEVNFYPTDLNDLASNTLRTSTKETEGEVAPLVVKEELYRTLLHVAGARPAWWGAPVGMDRAGYEGFIRSLNGSALEKRWDLIDFGYPVKPGPQEYLAAALWLSRKSEDDPFKGTLKLILILEQIENRLQSPQLCEVLKEKVLGAGPGSWPVDPYVLTIERVLGYADRTLPPKLVDLVRMAAFYKIRGPFDPSEGKPEDRKRFLLHKLARDWGWDERRFERLSRYSTWPEQERLALGRQMKELLFVLYTRAAKRLLTEFPDQVTPDDEHLAEFKARILARYSDHQATVETLPSSLDRKGLPSEITLVWTGRDWQLFGGLVEPYQMGVKKSKGKMIYQADRAARVAAWLVNNQIGIPEIRDQFHFFGAPFGSDAFFRLVETLYGLFPPLDLHKKTSKHRWIHGGVGPRLIVVNLETPGERYLAGVDLIYRTNWREMRHSTLNWKTVEDLAKRYQDVYDIINESGGIEREDINIFVHRNPAGRKIGNNLDAVLAGKIMQKQQYQTQSKGWLDTE